MGTFLLEGIKRRLSVSFIRIPGTTEVPEVHLSDTTLSFISAKRAKVNLKITLNKKTEDSKHRITRKKREIINSKKIQATNKTETLAC